MGSFPGHQATSCPFLSFSSFLLLGIGDVVWLDQVQLETSWEVLGFPEFMAYPEKAPVGKLRCSSSGYPLWGHCGCPLSPRPPWLPQCDVSVFFLHLTGWLPQSTSSCIFPSPFPHTPLQFSKSTYPPHFSLLEFFSLSSIQCRPYK